MKTYTITHGQLFREAHERQAESEYQLRQQLEVEHPEWFPVQIEVITEPVDITNRYWTGEG